MGYPTKVQLIQRKRGINQYYLSFPTPIAEALDLQKGEVVEWTIADKKHMILSRAEVPGNPVDIKKKRNRS